MKKINLLLILIIIINLVSCEYDNYDPPSIRMSGTLTCNGESFYYDGASGSGLLKVIQKGYGKVDTGTSIRVDETGNFNQLLFAGDYWLTLDNNEYPFEIQEFRSLGAGIGYDSIYIHLKSDVNLNFEVIPYYEFFDFTVAIEDGNIVMRANVKKNPKINGEVPDVTFARGYVSTSSIVNSASLCTRSARASITTGEGNIEVSIPVTGTATSYRQVYSNNFREYAFCRLSIELDNVPSYYLFTETQRVAGIPLE